MAWLGLAAAGYPVSVVAAVMLGVPWRNAPRQGLLVYVVFWLPGLVAYWWMAR